MENSVPATAQMKNGAWRNPARGWNVRKSPAQEADSLGVGFKQPGREMTSKSIFVEVPWIVRVCSFFRFFNAAHVYAS